MKLLLDTQLTVWWLAGDPRLPPKARTVVEHEAAEVFVSYASLWELAVKQSLGKVRLDLDVFTKAAEKTGFEWLDVSAEHVVAVGRLPVSGGTTGHGDPFARMLVAQSMAEPLILLTVNRKLARYGSTVRVI